MSGKLNGMGRFGKKARAYRQGPDPEEGMEPDLEEGADATEARAGAPIARRDLMALLGGAMLSVPALSAGSLLLGESKAYALPAGTVGLSFDAVTEVLAGEALTGRLYTFELGGADALQVSIDYDSSVFDGLTVEATNGVTILAQSDEADRLSVVLMIDPEKANYSNLLKVTAQAGSEGGTGTINLSYAKAAIKGTEYEQTSIGADDNTITVTETTLDTDAITLATLSQAMTFYQVTAGSARWPSAAKYDLVADGVIDIKDFVKIANFLLDLQNNIKLRFREDGSFKILQVSDYQDVNPSLSHVGSPVHPRTDALFQRMLDEEQPDVVIMTGDQLGGNMTADGLQAYLAAMMKPCEDRGIPWFMTYGNHDEDATTALADGWNKARQLEYYRSFPHNINRATMSGCMESTTDGNGRVHTDCVGDMYVLVYDTDGSTPLYNLWGLDSNRYEQRGVACPKVYSTLTQNGGWDYIRPGQIDWYYRTSQQLEERYGKLNSLMFFHIPLPEWSNMVAEHGKFGVSGLRGEGECPGNINTGLFGAAHRRGDVRGMFVGHDHINDYIGDYYGIKLAYDASIGYQTYGGEMKGGRVIELDKADLSTFSTRMVYAKDYGLEQGSGFSQPDVATSVASVRSITFA
jgi:hypothetical protein